jgi:RNA polymerase sigma-70 factor (ECF subfamily)
MARTGDRDAFAELVRRREPWLRTLLLRCCNNAALADDLSQHAFLQAWSTIGQLRQSGRFGPWLKRLAINTWLQHLRRSDPLRNSAAAEAAGGHRNDSTGIAIDLDSALATLAPDVRLCIVLAYHEGMTHDEIADLAGLPPGTVKSHIRRGSKRLRKHLDAYARAPQEMNQHDN